jgi:NTP pyrophosphatase (non-canonical NTP hydrolase)
MLFSNRIFSSYIPLCFLFFAMKSDISLLTEKLVAFRDERDWGQFHNPKDLAAALSIEASELLECWLWKKPEDAEMAKVREELADVFAYAFLLAERCGLVVTEIVLEKISKNAAKYPVETSKGSAKKYNEL